MEEGIKFGTFIEHAEYSGNLYGTRLASKFYIASLLCYVHVYLRVVNAFCNSQTEHDMETKLTSIDYSRQVAEGCRNSWLETLDNQLLVRFPYTVHVFGTVY